MPEIESEVLARAPAMPPLPRTRWGRHGATLIGLAVSAGVLVVLYRSLHIRQIGAALLGTNKAWLVISIGAIVPITALRAFRFLRVAPPRSLPGFGDAFRLTLAASALNVFVPAKAGDLIKSYFVATRGHTSASVAIAVIVYERLCDLFGLATWCLLGWLVGRPDIEGVPSWFWGTVAVFGALCAALISSERLAGLLPTIVGRLCTHRRLRRVRELADGWPDLLRMLRGRRRWIVTFSLLLWFAHLFQVWLFTVALSVDVPIADCASLAAVALMAGQLPLTFAGLGPRDVALVVLLSPYMAAESAAAMGVLIATRNFLPPLIGLPMMGSYISSAVEAARQWRRGVDLQ